MAQEITMHVGALVEAAEREIDTLSADRAVALHGRADVVLVDLRDIRELDREGRVPGAFHCPRGMLEFWVDPRPANARRSQPRPRNAWASSRSPISPAGSRRGKPRVGRSSHRPQPNRSRDSRQ